MKQTVTKPTKTQVRSRTGLWAVFVLGIAVGIFCLLFAAVNNDWIVIKIPEFPWKTSPYSVAFETRIWAVILTSFSAGVVTVGFAYLKARHRWATRFSAEKRRAAQAEERLEKLNKLVEDGKGKTP